MSPVQTTPGPLLCNLDPNRPLKPSRENLTMDTFKVNGASLEYQASGSGEAVLLVHGAIVADSFAPMLDGSDLRENYQVITYHRRGFCRRAPASEGRTLSDDGADVVALLDHLGVAKAHVVGHSSAVRSRCNWRWTHLTVCTASASWSHPCSRSQRPRDSSPVSDPWSRSSKPGTSPALCSPSLNWSEGQTR